VEYAVLKKLPALNPCRTVRPEILYTTSLFIIRLRIGAG
jgi:hypothetical protein